MNNRALLLALSCTICVLAASVTAAAQNFGKLFVVDTAADSIDAIPGDQLCADTLGRCSLRAAVQESNFTPLTRDAVIFALPDPAIIDLTLGELAVTGRIAIVGPGARRLTIQRSSAAGTPDNRVFRIAAGVTNSVLRNIKIRNGRVDGSGGAILVEAGAAVTASDLWINGNHARTGGGIANAGDLTVVRSLIDNNEVGLAAPGERGAGIANVGAQSTLKIINSTITANRGTTSGAIDNTGSLTLVNTTLARNFASDSCTTMCNWPGGTVSVLNTLIGPDTEAPSRNALSGTFVTLGNNIVTDSRGAIGFVNGVNGDQVSELNALDPKIGPLSNNGGETDTLPLLTASPAIDQGNSCVSNGTCPGFQLLFLRTDQRSGYFRGLFLTPVDVGAFEYNAFHGSSSSTFGFFSPNRPAFYGGAISVVTNAVTRQTAYSAMNPFGRNRLRNLGPGVWIMEIRAKRAAIGMDPQVLSSEDVPLLSILDSGINIVVQPGPPNLDVK